MQAMVYPPTVGIITIHYRPFNYNLGSSIQTLFYVSLSAFLSSPLAKQIRVALLSQSRPFQIFPGPSPLVSEMSLLVAHRVDRIPRRWATADTVVLGWERNLSPFAQDSHHEGTEDDTAECRHLL